MKKRIATPADTMIENFFKQFTKGGHIKPDLCNIRAYYFVNECLQQGLSWAVVVALDRDGSIMGEKENWRGHVSAAVRTEAGLDFIDPHMVEDQQLLPKAVSDEHWKTWFSSSYSSWGGNSSEGSAACAEQLLFFMILDEAVIHIDPASSGLKPESEGGKFLNQIIMNLRMIQGSKQRGHLKTSYENILDPYVLGNTSKVPRFFT